MLNLEAEKMIFAAGVLIDSHQAGEAASVLQECIIRFPDSGKAHALLGHVYDRFFREPFTAEDHFKKAMMLSPDFTKTYLYYAEALLAQERYTEMTAMLNKALETTAAEKDEIYFLFGMMNEKQSKYEEAVDDYQKAIVYSFSDDAIENYNKAIARCVAKQKLFTGLG